MIQAIRWEVKFWRQLDLAVAGLMDGQMDPVLDFYHRLTRLIQDKDKLIEGKSKRKEFVSQGKEVEKEIPAALHSLEEELERLDQMIEYLLNASDEVPEDVSLLSLCRLSFPLLCPVLPLSIRRSWGSD